MVEDYSIIPNQSQISRKSLDFTYQVLVNDVIGIVAIEFKSQYSIRALAKKLNNVYQKLGLKEISYQRLYQLMESRGGGKHEQT